MWKWLSLVLVAGMVGLGTLYVPPTVSMAQQSYPLEPFQCPAGQFTYAFNPVTGGLPGWFCATPGVAKQIVTPPATTVGDLAVWGNTNGTSLIDNGTAFPSITVASNNALKALPVPVAGTVAYRAGFATAGDLGGATYTFSSTNCSISGGDNGLQVQPNVGTGCWIASIPIGGLSIAVWGVNTTASDNSTALEAALTAALANNFALYIPAGTFNFTNPVSGTIPGGQSFTLFGAGQDVTILSWTGASGGVQLNYTNEHASLTAHDFTFFTNTAGGGTGLSLIQDNASINNEAASALTSITNVTFRGGLGSNTANYWTTAFEERGISNVMFSNVTVFLGTNGSNGDAFNLSGLSSASQSVGINFTNVNVAGGRYGIIYGSWVQGVTVVNSYFDEQLTNILVNGSGGGTVLNVANSQFGLNLGDFVDIEGLINGVNIKGTDFQGIPTGFAGLKVNSVNATGIVFNGNRLGGLTADVGTGVNVVTTNSAGRNLIEANLFSGLNTGISLASTAHKVLIGNNNSFNGNGFNVIDNETDTVYSSSVPVAGSSGSVSVVGGGGPVFMSYGPSGDASEANVSLPAPTAQTVSLTGCLSNAAPGAGQTFTLAIRHNGSTTSNTCTISGTSGVGTLSGSPIALAANDVWSVIVTPSAGAASANVKWAGAVVPAP